MSTEREFCTEQTASAKQCSHTKEARFEAGESVIQKRGQVIKTVKM